MASCEFIIASVGIALSELSFGNHRSRECEGMLEGVLNVQPLVIRHW